MFSNPVFILYQHDRHIQRMKPSPQELAERYATLSNLQLFEILNDGDSYTPDALALVKEEIDRRNLAEHEIQKYLAELGANHAASIQKANVELAFWEKTFFFFVWFTPGFISIALGMNYHHDGFETKLKQSRFFRLAGFTSLILVGLLSTYFHLLDFLGFALLIPLFGIAWIVSQRINWIGHREKF